MDFKNGVKNVQTVAHNGKRTVCFLSNAAILQRPGFAILQILVVICFLWRCCLMKIKLELL